MHIHRFTSGWTIAVLDFQERAWWYSEPRLGIFLWNRNSFIERLHQTRPLCGRLRQNQEHWPIMSEHRHHLKSSLKSESHSVVSYSLWPHGLHIVGILQARTLEWVAFPFFWGSSQPRDGTQVSCPAGRFLTSWATREAEEYWSGKPIPSPADLPDPGIEPGFPELQADSLPAELPGKP